MLTLVSPFTRNTVLKIKKVVIVSLTFCGNAGEVVNGSVG